MKTMMRVAALALITLPMLAWAAPGDGVGGVEVGMRKRPGGQIVAVSVTEQAGNFSLPGLSAGSYQLVLTIAGGHRNAVADTAKSFFESRSNTARNGAEWQLQFAGWPYTVTMSGTGVRAGAGNIREVAPASGSRRSVAAAAGVQIDVDVDIEGSSLATLSGRLRFASSVADPAVPPVAFPLRPATRD